MTVRTSAAAEADTRATALWYDTQPGRYGDAFNDEVLAATRAIAANPRLYPPAEDAPPGLEVREYLIRRFSQRVIYRINGEDVLVVAVVHASRRPGSWHRQLNSE